MVLRPSSSIRSHFSNIFSSKTAWPIKTKFYVEPPWEGGTKVYINGPGHMTKMAAMLKNAQNLKNLLLQNHWANCLETWHVASGSVVLQSLYKSWPLVDLDLFCGKVNFGSMGIWMGKSEIFHFSDANALLRMEMKSSPSLMNARGQGHFLTLTPGHLHMKIKTCFSKKLLGRF